MSKLYVDEIKEFSKIKGGRGGQTFLILEAREATTLLTFLTQRRSTAICLVFWTMDSYRAELSEEN